MKDYASSTSEIQDCFRGKSVFITGGTGFIGKALIEKLLWSCPDVQSIFVLIRGKRGSDAYARLSDLLIEPIFDTLREFLPHVLAKVVAIEGDIALPLLGISPDNLNLLRKTVSIVIHSAATIKFNEPLNVAMNINLGGTREVLELAGSMELIKAVVHVSTAFSNCERSFIEEKIYPVRTDPVAAIAMYQKCVEEYLETTTPMLLGDKPNTYVLTKHLAVVLVHQRKMDVPICIVRPSIVTAAYNHPIPGYVDNFSAMSGILAGVMTGVVRTLLFNDQYLLDVVPLDYVVNLIIAAASKLSKTSDRFISIYHKMGKSIDVLTYFCTNVWKFSGENTTGLFQSLPPCDQANFPFDVSDINWGQHMTQYIQGMRKYAFKDESSEEGAVTSLCKLRRKHQFVKCLVLAPFLMGMFAAMVSFLPW